MLLKGGEPSESEKMKVEGCQRRVMISQLVLRKILESNSENVPDS